MCLKCHILQSWRHDSLLLLLLGDDESSALVTLQRERTKKVKEEKKREKRSLKATTVCYIFHSIFISTPLA